MNKSTPKIIDTILGSPEQFTLNHRVFNVVTFSGIIIAGLAFLSDLALGGPKSYLFSFIVTIVFLTLYSRSRKTTNYLKLIWPYIITEYVIIIYDWYMLGGVTGASLLIAISFVAAIPIILSGTLKYTVLAGVILVCAVIFIAEILDPMLVIYYDTRSSHIIDVFVTAVFIGIGIVLAISLVMQSHHIQHDKIRSLNESLEKTNRLLEDRNDELENALEEIKQLSGMLPICSFCKNIRDDKGYWKQIESYIRDHSEAEFSHSICPECAKKHYPDLDL